MGGTKILSLGILWLGILSGIIAPRPAGPYPDISLAGKNPMSVALTERHHKSQDNYLLGKKMKVTVATPSGSSAALFFSGACNKISTNTIVFPRMIVNRENHFKM